MNIERFILETKVGHFLFLLIVTGVVSYLVATITPLSFKVMFTINIICAFVFSICDKNKRWI